MKKHLPLLLGLLAASLGAQTILVQPHVQPGDGSTLGTTDVKVVAWMTDQPPGEFVVGFDWAGQPEQTVQPRPTVLNVTPGPQSESSGPDADRAPPPTALSPTPAQQYLTYAATLTGLPFNAEIHYRVKLKDQMIREGTFRTRKTPDQPLHFVVVGDLADDRPPHREVAAQMARAQPEFLIVCGDIVYDRGRLSQYMANFWPAYCNPAQPDPAVGAPLMQSVPFYAVLGNHDVELADLAKIPDAFAAFYFFHPPRNAPAGPWTTVIPGAPEQVANFKSAASGAGYPHLSLYSFDNGPAHFLVLDSDNYVPVTDPAFHDWIRRDLTGSRAVWKFVFFHHPGFNSNRKHAGEQKMRLLAPLFEECGVDAVFAGHVHDYQRSKPLRFTPNDPAPKNATGPIRGTFALDEQFDGVTHTVPRGIVYFVTGGGGSDLYTRTPGESDLLVPDPDTATSFTAKFISDRHSFSVIDLDARQLTLRQIDLKGNEVDRVTITKPAK